MQRAAPAAAGAPALPELASVYWRPRATANSLSQRGKLWTLTTVAHTVPFLAGAAVLGVLKPVTVPVCVVLLVHAWVIPELYAARGAGVVRTARRRDGQAEHIALGLLGDLLDHGARDAHARTGLVPERGRLGVWLIGEAGALLVGPRGRRVYCYCVRAVDPDLPAGDRIAHLLLALREDESGFATVANLVFVGAPWRVRRRLPQRAREALALAVADARGREVKSPTVG